MPSETLSLAQNQKERDLLALVEKDRGVELMKKIAQLILDQDRAFRGV